MAPASQRQPNTTAPPPPNLHISTRNASPAVIALESTQPAAGIPHAWLESPTWPTHPSLGPSPQRVQPRFSSEPPMLDLASTTSVFESPALMPANVALNLPSIDQLPGQMNG